MMKEQVKFPVKGLVVTNSRPIRMNIALQPDLVLGFQYVSQGNPVKFLGSAHRRFLSINPLGSFFPFSVHQTNDGCSKGQSLESTPVDAHALPQLDQNFRAHCRFALGRTMTSKLVRYGLPLLL